MGKFVKVPLKEYLSLENSKNKLQALEGGGVDNWEWYEESLETLEDFTEGDITLPIIEE